MENPVEASFSFDELSAAVICREDALDGNGPRKPDCRLRSGCSRNGIRYMPYRYEYVLDRTRISVAEYLRSHGKSPG